MGRHTTFNQEIADYLCEQIADRRGLREILREDTKENLPNLIGHKEEENLSYLKEILDKYGKLPSSASIYKWLTENSTFSEQYARARIIQAHILSDEIREIADDSVNDTKVDEDGNHFIDHELVQRSRLRIDARKWLAGKFAPKVYGDKIEQTLQNPDGSGIVTNLEVTFRKSEK